MARKQTERDLLAQEIIKKYQTKSVEDMQNTLKDIFGPMIQAMLNGEMHHHLGYANNERGEKSSANRRNGYCEKTLKTSFGDVPVGVPVTVTQPSSPRLFPNTKRMCQILRIRFWPCMRVA